MRRCYGDGERLWPSRVQPIIHLQTRRLQLVDEKFAPDKIETDKIEEGLTKGRTMEDRAEEMMEKTYKGEQQIGRLKEIVDFIGGS